MGVKYSYLLLKVISKMLHLQYFSTKEKNTKSRKYASLVYLRKTLNLKLIFLLSLIRTGILRKTPHLNAIFIY